MNPNDEIIERARAMRIANRIARESGKARRERDAAAFAEIKALPAPLGAKFPSRYKAG